MSSHLEDAIRRWNGEVSEEAARLIEGGTPPIEAMRRAELIVERRRREEKAGFRLDIHTDPRCVARP